MDKRYVKILDSTLRDGAQGEEISFSVSDKLYIARTLDAFGVSYIEAGNPGSNPKDLEFFLRMKDEHLKNARLCAFGSTRRKNKSVETDDNIAALLSADTPVAVIFGKAWDLHVTKILDVSLEENLKMISETVTYLKKRGKEVVFDAEHFFDGYEANPGYAQKAIEAACDAGADSICLCDTNGGTLPMRIYETIRQVCGWINIPVGIHAHDDAGCAIANSVMAVQAGAVQVQGTFIGFGERCGNASLSGIIPALACKLGISCDGDLVMLSETAEKIASVANVSIRNNQPYVGRSAFSHKAGMHIDGVLKNPMSFEHIDPASVGNERRFLISEAAGRGSVLEKIRSLAPELTKDSPELAAIIERIKELEHFGYQFESADASFELLVKKILGDYSPHFSVVLYKTMGEFPSPDGDLQATAMIKVDVDGKTEINAAMGKGPINALDIALRRALTVFYPEIEQMHLTDYKVRVLEQKAATEAKVRVMIESSDESGSWNTIGVSEDIIEASLTALVDSIEYKLAKRI